MDREEFDKQWTQHNKKMSRGFNIAAGLSILWAIVILIMVGVGIYLALKNWG